MGRRRGRTKVLQNEVIVWRDAWWGYETRPFEPDEIVGGHYLVDTGFLVKEDKDEVIICSSTSADPDNDRVKFVHGILKKNIVSRESSTVRIEEKHA